MEVRKDRNVTKSRESIESVKTAIKLWFSDYFIDRV